MNYKVIEKDDEVFFKYKPEKNYKKKIKKNILKESPFGVLKNLNLG